MRAQATPHGDRRRALILGFIRDFVDRHGFSPTVRQIAEGVGFKSCHSVHDQLRKLKAAGRIKRVGRRGLVLVGHGSRGLKVEGFVS